MIREIAATIQASKPLKQVELQIMAAKDEATAPGDAAKK
jgi:hypothetical protein